MAFSLPKNSPMRSSSFLYGVATASFQIEGGVEHRLPCIWDTFCATDGKIEDGSNGDVACDHFNRWQDDVALISSFGVDAYRLSISWPRVIKQDGTVNQEGMKFYIDLLDELNAQGIKPFVTLYHWDLPQYLEDNGGWLNRETAYKFQEYTKHVVQALGERVHAYATLNEPFCSAYLGYEAGIHAPGLVGKEYGKKAAHHLLLAHGLAMQVLNEFSPNTLNGIVLNFTPGYAMSDSPADQEATRKANEYFNYWYSKPIFDGEYPELINELPAENRPEIHDNDMAIISQPMDFLGINFYTRARYQAHPTDMFEEIIVEGVERTDIGWEVYPKAFTELLVDLNTRYNLPPVYITENGASIDDEIESGVVNDVRRIDYYNKHLNAVNDAISLGVNVQGYFAWSLMDNFEWAEGYLKRFGIVYVDYQTQVRTVKASGLAYKKLLSERS
ncbi:GH1 family beta-glucosidase [Thalassotalea castellviae]|uniref:Beta-glucosidase n=1 Tax=Thalassotalea castellviae TaxID=3075612 RepID=A0ABU3A168_9GAMM|nr:GH1 family beta-glucosidase [Thalassotalea sp. W431]MDT0603922.1 GH1 family beta-glucosidase [Thalassotalea sp. W431]